MLEGQSRFRLMNPWHLLALGFGSGLVPWAPGTVGTLFGWLIYVAVRPQLTDQHWIGVLVAGFLLGVVACHKAGRDVGVADHGSIVWDEIVAIWLVLLFTPPLFDWQLAAFVLFRTFDIFKLPPCDWIDRHMKNGLGVMLDDIVAALYALAALALIRHVMG